MNVTKFTGKLTGKLVATTKESPSRTKSGLENIKNSFVTGYREGFGTYEVMDELDDLPVWTIHLS